MKKCSCSIKSGDEVLTDDRGREVDAAEEDGQRADYGGERWIGRFVVERPEQVAGVQHLMEEERRFQMVPRVEDRDAPILGQPPAGECDEGRGSADRPPGVAAQARQADARGRRRPRVVGAGRSSRDACGGGARG
jgi:hypothetical protein